MTPATKIHEASLAHVPWKMLPSTPTLSFTIPSLHDGTTLDCRVFHPRALNVSSSSSSSSKTLPTWRRDVAVVAHPYAPLGGNQDDPVVDLVAGTLLKHGFLVGTFNFRGAGSSSGRTSWTAKPERADYASFAAFLYYYAHFLDPFLSPPDAAAAAAAARPPSSPTSADPSSPATTPSPPTFLFAGYSYGAMVTSLLPALPAILAPLAAPLTGTRAAEIRLRAQHLAESQNAAIHAALLRSRQPHTHAASKRSSLGVRVGGDEDLQRRSHDGARRSFTLEDAEERIRKGVAELVARTRPGGGDGGRPPSRRRSWRSHGHGHGHGHGHEKTSSSSLSVEDIPEERADTADGLPGHQEEHHLPVVEGLYTPRVAYLMVSPPVGMMTNLATMSFPLPWHKKGPSHPKKHHHLHHPDERANSEAEPGKHDGDDDDSNPDAKLMRSPSLAIYGDADTFLSAKKMRAWCKRLAASGAGAEGETGAAGTLFRAHEVSTAGHFWSEGKTIYVLRDAVGAFAAELVGGGGKAGGDDGEVESRIDIGHEGP